MILISTGCITRPYSIPSLILNHICGNVMTWKLLAENLLRTSGLDYTIIRPGNNN
jgi:hypothetical protein